MSPEAALQKAVYEALTGASPPVGRVYDTVPPSPVFPYITFGPLDTTQEDTDCDEGVSISFQMDTWSNAVGRIEAVDLAAAMRRALRDADLDLDEHALVLLRHDDSRVIPEPENGATHVASRFTAVIEVAG